MSASTTDAPSPPPPLPGMVALTELAMDLRWTWNHCSDELWRRLDPELWALTHHPNVCCKPWRETSLRAPYPIRTSANCWTAWFRPTARRWQSRPGFRTNIPRRPHLRRLFLHGIHVERGASHLFGRARQRGRRSAQSRQRSWRAGDGVGLLYQHGYFRQLIDRNGAQQALYPYNDPGQLPITPVRQANGELLRLEVALPGSSVWLRAWQVQVGRQRLYLLDSQRRGQHPRSPGHHQRALRRRILSCA
jgi:starch phosphorylase